MMKTMEINVSRLHARAKRKGEMKKNLSFFFSSKYVLKYFKVFEIPQVIQEKTYICVEI